MSIPPSAILPDVLETLLRAEAAEVDFSDQEQAQAWFEHQTREVCITFAVRSALRVLPLIGQDRSTQEFAPGVALPVLRACFVAWAIVKHPLQLYYLRDADIAAAADAAYAAATDAVAAVYAAAAAADTAVDYEIAAYPAAAATADAAAAAAAVDYAAVTYTAAVWADTIAIEKGRAVAEIITTPLWPDGMPERLARAWDRLRTWMLADEANSWAPWVQWYERVRDGRPSFGEAFDFAVTSLTEEQWNEEPRPAAVNRRITALLAEHTPPEPIPPLVIGDDPRRS